MLGLISSISLGAGGVVASVASSGLDVDPVHSVAVVVVVVSDAGAAGSAWVCRDKASAWALFLLRSAFRRNMSSLRASTFENKITVFYLFGSLDHRVRG